MDELKSGVPVWVPILVGVLGVLGVVGGQLINAWREDRRWKREQQREDLRWQREMDRISIQNKHERALRLHEKKAELYAEALHASKLLKESVAKLSIYRQPSKTRGNAVSEFLEATTKQERSIILLELYGSPRVAEAFKELKRVVDANFFDIVSDEASVEKLKAVEVKMKTQYDNALDAARGDIG